MELEITVHGKKPGWHNLAKTHCPKGHPLSGENLYSYRNQRHCKKCNSDRSKAKSKHVEYSHGRFRTHCLKGHEFTAENVYITPKSGRRQCVTCKMAYSEKYVHEPQKARDNQKRFRERHPEKVAHGLRMAQIRRKGITIEQHAAMLSAQNGLCAICKGPPPAHRSLDVDHCHATNKVRGLLCSSCNVALGHFRDDIALLNEAQIYLWKSGGGKLNHLKINE